MLHESLCLYSTLLYFCLTMTYRNQGISSSLPTSVTVMSTLCCQPKSYTEHLQIMASVSRCHHFLLPKPYKRSASRVLIPSMLNYFCLLVTSFSSPQSVVQPGTWSCFVRMMSRPGPAGSQPCACSRLACWSLTLSDVWEEKCWVSAQIRSSFWGWSRGTIEWLWISIPTIFIEAACVHCLDIWWIQFRAWVTLPLVYK